MLEINLYRDFIYISRNIIQNSGLEEEKNGVRSLIMGITLRVSMLKRRRLHQWVRCQISVRKSITSNLPSFLMQIRKSGRLRVDLYGVKFQVDS